MFALGPTIDVDQGGHFFPCLKTLKKHVINNPYQGGQ